MKLDENINYIVSGLERSGTSMMMQILKAGGIPIYFDESRKADDNNPKGYFEVEGGKIINRLIDKTFDMNFCLGKFIKITAYGLSFLPQGSYKIIYMERNLDEVLDSMEKMVKITDEERKLTKDSFRKLNDKTKNELQNRDDVDVLFVNYNDMIDNPNGHILSVLNFLNLNENIIEKMLGVVDKDLYRQRRG